MLRREGDDYIVNCDTFRVKVPEEKLEKSPAVRSSSISGWSWAFGRRILPTLGLLPESRATQAITAMVAVTEPMGAEVYVHFTAGEHKFIGRLKRDEAPPTDSTSNVFDLNKMHLFDAETELAIR